ncbi:MAG: glycerol-3-phosphate 1-O-acyltransferase PlsY [Deltaproteobacteria bacterium]|nr:glycerol-3-phosphate 1-O-acyltransferase PlsY [Deltaproteobacteria bacterium]
MAYYFFLAGAYLLGSIPCGLIIGRLAAGIDVRRSGSGNIGATNVLRAAGKAWGGLTLAADVLKGVLPVWAAGQLWSGRPDLAAWAGLAVVAGHCYPVYLGFKGGKGVATALGVFLIVAPKAVAVGVLVFSLALALTRRVSVGSLLAILGVLAAIFWWGGQDPVLIASSIMAGLIFFRHKDNIVRLLSGQENRLTLDRS